MPVYIFDDTFSALDFKTDAKLRKALKGYTEGATVLIVAQRVSTIMHAEQIVVLDEGRVMGIGTHEELLSGCALYRSMWQAHLGAKDDGTDADIRPATDGNAARGEGKDGGKVC